MISPMYYINKYYAYSGRFFTYLSLISFGGLIIRAIRRELSLWNGSGVFRDVKPNEVNPLFGQQVTRTTCCESCGQEKVTVVLRNRPQYCTKMTLYIYLFMVILICALLVGVLAFGGVYPVYALFVSPLILRKGAVNMNLSVSNNSSFTDIVWDSIMYRNFSTEILPIQPSYQTILNSTILRGSRILNECQSHLSPIAGLLNVYEDWNVLMDMKDDINDSIITDLARLKDLLNDMLVKYADYLPMDNVIVNDTVSLIRTSNFSMETIQQFVQKHNVFIRDPLDVRIVEIKEIYENPFLLVNQETVDELSELIQIFKSNMTTVSTDVVSTSVDMYRIMERFFFSFVHGEDLSQYDTQLSASSIEMLSKFQEMYLHYSQIGESAMSAVPLFIECINEQVVVESLIIRQEVKEDYVGYFRKHWFFSFCVCVIVVGLVGCIVLQIIQGVKLILNTAKFARSCVKRASSSIQQTTSELKDMVHQSSLTQQEKQALSKTASIEILKLSDGYLNNVKSLYDHCASVPYPSLMDEVHQRNLLVNTMLDSLDELHYATMELRPLLIVQQEMSKQKQKQKRE